MKNTILGFRYWIDEPGEALMHMGSENHRLLLHSAEYLAGQLFPSDEFPNSQQRGLFHILKGRMYLIEWLQQRGKFGFDEWNSNCYYAVNTAPLTNVYDFTPRKITLSDSWLGRFSTICFLSLPKIHFMEFWNSLWKDL